MTIFFLLSQNFRILHCKFYQPSCNKYCADPTPASHDTPAAGQRTYGVLEVSSGRFTTEPCRPLRTSTLLSGKHTRSMSWRWIMNLRYVIKVLVIKMCLLLFKIANDIGFAINKINTF